MDGWMLKAKWMRSALWAYHLGWRAIKCFQSERVCVWVMLMFVSYQLWGLKGRGRCGSVCAPNIVCVCVCVCVGHPTCCVLSVVIWKAAGETSADSLLWDWATRDKAPLCVCIWERERERECVPVCAGISPPGVACNAPVSPESLGDGSSCTGVFHDQVQFSQTSLCSCHLAL